MEKEIKTKKALFVQNKVMAVSRKTKRKSATVMFEVDDDLAQRLIHNAQLSAFDLDFKVVGLTLNWTNVDEAPNVTRS